MKAACSWPGCPEVINSGDRFCEEHWKEHRKKQDKRREKTKQRGYGGRWQKIRSNILANEPFCRRCKRQGMIAEATVVHHIDGNVWNIKKDNLEPLCKSCHDSITMRDVVKGDKGE